MQRRRPQKLNLLALRQQYTNPHTLYNAMRARDSIYFDETIQSWLVTGHRATTTMLDDPRFLSGLSMTPSSDQLASVSRQMLFMDGERHRSAQDVMLRPLAHMVKNMPEDIRNFTQRAIQKIREKKEMDVVSEFASPLSLFTIAHVLGIPLDDEEKLLQLERWSDTFGDITSGYFQGTIQDIEKLEDYFRSLIAEKRRVPTDDLLSSFIEARDIFPQDEDLVANCMMVFAAGRITTKKLLGNGLALLMPHWQEFQTAFQENPRFPRQLGEELLRMVTPTRYLIREASEDIDLSERFPGNHTICRGQKVLLFLEAANYDPDVFTDPEQFNPHRRPNKQIAFGYGPHQCPGATLARLEIQIALEEILSLAHLRPKPEMTPIWNANPNLGGFTSYQIVFQ